MISENIRTTFSNLKIFIIYNKMIAYTKYKRNNYHLISFKHMKNYTQTLKVIRIMLIHFHFHQMDPHSASGSLDKTLIPGISNHKNKSAF